MRAISLTGRHRTTKGEVSMDMKIEVAVNTTPAEEQYNLSFDDVANSVGVFEIKGSKTLLVGLGNGNAVKISGGFGGSTGYSNQIIGAPRSQYQTRQFRRKAVSSLSLSLVQQ